MPNWSKAPWGLSVLARVASIFTGTSISPDVLPRQRSNHYAFRAGRNLPDKEFRYLRTVIVTAAVYWGLNSKLRVTANLSSAPSSTGQASAHIPHLTVLHRPVFLLNSCLSLFSAANSRWHPFSRSYGVILPSSLTMLLPPALGFSPHPPVSVYGTGILKTIAAFLDSWLTHFPTLVRSASRLWIATRFFLCDSSFACTRLSVPRLCSPQMSPQFCFKIVQESQPAVHRIRISASP